MRAKPGRRLPEALAVRDAALAKRHAEGRVTEDVGTQSIDWESPDGLTMKHTIFVNTVPKRYWLDIWEPHRKVLNIQWDESGDCRLLNFRRGAWEGVVLVLGATRH